MLKDYDVVLGLQAYGSALEAEHSCFSENTQVHCSELNQHTVQRYHEEITSKPYSCSNSITAVDISYCVPQNRQTL